MDWSTKGERPNQTPAQPGHAPTVTGGASAAKTSKFRGDGMSKPFRIVSVVLLFSATILIVALLISLFFGSSKPEGKFVDNKKMQAVFLNGGQVYFGKVQELNSKYLRITNIYYLRVNQQVQPNQSTNQNNDISLVKLGCELHGPVDEMVVNRDQVTFWENLKADGQVAKAVESYVKANPNGQKCDATSNSSSSSNSSTDTTTNSTSTSTKKQ